MTAYWPKQEKLMPMLPSGRHVGIDSTLLQQLINEAETGIAVHKLMAVTTTGDLRKYVQLINLVPTQASDELFTSDSKHSVSAPTNLKRVETGIRLSDTDQLASQFSAEDWAVFKMFLESPRVGDQFADWLKAVDETKQALLKSNSFAARVLAGMWQAGVHPGQAEGWANEDIAPLRDGRQPWEWDFYDALAAYLRIAERVRQGLYPLADWLPRADGYLAIAFKCLPGLAIHGFADSDTPRELATHLREEKLLDDAPMPSAKWLKEQLIMECNQLYDSEGFDELRPLLPEDTEIIEIVAISIASSD